MYIGNGYYITSDAYQYIVEKRTLKKNGNDIGGVLVRNISYNPTVVSALNSILRRLQRGDIDLGDEPELVHEAFCKRLEEVKELFGKCEQLEIGGNDEALQDVEDQEREAEDEGFSSTRLLEEDEEEEA